MEPPPPNDDEPRRANAGVSDRPWHKPTVRMLVAGWFGDLGVGNSINETYYEGSPLYPPSSSANYTNPPS